MDDDVWELSDDDQAAYDRTIAQKEWDRLNDNHGNEGYKEGIVEGKEVRMQQGFDRGYKEGLAVGKAMGTLRGLVNTHIILYRDMLNNQEKAKELTELYQQLCAVDVQHVFQKEYFQDDTQADPMLTVQKWQEIVRRALATAE